MIAVWALAGVLALAAFGARELRWILVPIVVILVAFGLMCERGQRAKDREMS